MIFLSFMNLFRSKRRTAAILLTIALGTGVLFLFGGFISGVLNQYRESTIHAHYGHGQINTKGYRESVYQKPWTHWIDNFSDINAFLISQENVTDVFPRVSFPALLKNNSASISGFGNGILAEKEAAFFSRLNIEEGKMLNNEENGILLGKGLAKALGAKPGDRIKLFVSTTHGNMGEDEFIVTGIFHTGSVDFDGKTFRIQLAKAQKLLKTSAVESVSLGLKSHEEWKSFSDAFTRAFPSLEATPFNILDQVYYQNSVDWLNAQFGIVQAIILSIVLLGIFNSISASVLERKQEIGNFRANGESVADVMRLITLEGAFLGALGAVLGITFTFLLAKLLLENGVKLPPGPGSTKSFYISFSFTWEMALSSIFLSTLASTVASFLAGARVAKMPIAKALRS